MVYIHGGGLLFDSARQVPSEQLSLRDVVVVTFNYRLGVFGFLCTDREDAPGNVGLWDQAMALNWTQNNIRNFGGNPEDVTLFGQSAGSVSVSSHIVSHVSRPYFKKAILQSGLYYLIFIFLISRISSVTYLSPNSVIKILLAHRDHSCIKIIVKN
jgi:carboxylesterase type B